MRFSPLWGLGNTFAGEEAVGFILDVTRDFFHRSFLHLCIRDVYR